MEDRHIEKQSKRGKMLRLLKTNCKGKMRKKAAAGKPCPLGRKYPKSLLARSFGPLSK